MHPKESAQVQSPALLEPALRDSELARADGSRKSELIKEENVNYLKLNSTENSNVLISGENANTRELAHRRDAEGWNVAPASRDPSHQHLRTRAPKQTKYRSARCHGKPTATHVELYLYTLTLICT